MKKKLVAIMAIFLIGTIFVLPYPTGYINLALKATFVFFFATIALLPIMAALYMFLALIFNLYKTFVSNVAMKVATDKHLEDTIASHFYFIKDMGPSVSSVSIVAFFVSTDASLTKLVIMFFVGVLMKYFARRFLRIFYRNIRLLQGRSNDRNSNDN